jgi:hypothetical protein
MSRAGFEIAIPAIKRPQTYALDRTAKYNISVKQILFSEHAHDL